MFKVAFSLISNINQSACSPLDWMFDILSELTECCRSIIRNFQLIRRAIDLCRNESNMCMYIIIHAGHVWIIISLKFAVLHRRNNKFIIIKSMQSSLYAHFVVFMSCPILAFNYDFAHICQKTQPFYILYFIARSYCICWRCRTRYGLIGESCGFKRLPSSWITPENKAM